MGIREDMASIRNDKNLSIGERIKQLQRYRGWDIAHLAAAAGKGKEVISAARKNRLPSSEARAILDIVADPFVCRPRVSPEISKEEVSRYLRGLHKEDYTGNLGALWCGINDGRSVQAEWVDEEADALIRLCDGKADSAIEIKRRLMDLVAEPDAKARRYGFMSLCGFMKQEIVKTRRKEAS